MSHADPPRLPILEAACELGLARLLTLLPERRYFPILGLVRSAPGAAPDATPDGAPDGPDADRVFEAHVVGHAVAVAAARMPFRAVCLQQSIATRRMLARRGIAAEIRFGLLAGEGGIAARAGRDAAHAWVLVAGSVVNGMLERLDDYVVVGRYR